MIPLKMFIDILDLIDSGDMTISQAIDLLDQKVKFEHYRKSLERAFSGRHVLLAGGRVFAGNDFDALATRVQHSLNRPFYSERLP